MSAPGVSLRPARREDVPAIVAMLADDPLGRGRERMSDPLPQSYFAAFDAVAGAPHCLLTVADSATEGVVGCLQLCMLPGLSSQGATRALIEDVRVATHLRSRGIGEMLIRWAIGEALSRGCKLVELFTHESRIDAQRFYKRLGFAPSHVGMTMGSDLNASCRTDVRQLGTQPALSCWFRSIRQETSA